MQVKNIFQRWPFTILELLIVIAIIMVLMSMLLPAFKKAKDSARMIACSNNLRQIGLLMAQYTNENNDFYPYCYFSDGTFWGNKLVETGELKLTKNNSIFICPAVPKENLSPNPYFLAYTSYGISRYGVAPNYSDTTRKPARTAKVPPNLLVAVDFEHRSQPYDGWYYSTQYDFSEGQIAVNLTIRHNKRFNYLCTDGRVISTSLEYIRTSQANNVPWYDFIYCR